MGTIIKKDGFKVVIRTKDHEPAHVHVFKAGKEAKLTISSGAELMRDTNMKEADVAKAKVIVSENYDLLIEEWKKIHG